MSIEEISLPFICTKEALLPGDFTVCVPALELEVVEHIIRQYKQILVCFVDGDQQKEVTLEQLQESPAMLCSIKDATKFRDNSYRLTLFGDALVEIDELYTNIAFNSDTWNVQGKNIKRASFHKVYQGAISEWEKAECQVIFAVVLDAYKNFCKGLIINSESLLGREVHLGEAIDCMMKLMLRIELVAKSIKPALYTRIILQYLRLRDIDKKKLFMYCILWKIVYHFENIAKKDKLQWLEEIEAQIHTNRDWMIWNELRETLTMMLPYNMDAADQLSPFKLHDEKEQVTKLPEDDDIFAVVENHKHELTEEVYKKCCAELRKIKGNGQIMDGETPKTINYIKTLLNLPWKKKSPIKKNIVQAQQVLDHDHYGLEKVKERILGYLAVQARSDRINSPIICLVGPPGVGKTSLGQSIAKATGRQYIRIALGGVHDETAIRGFERTYQGSQPGKFIKSLIRCGVRNPLFLLDEIDKLGGQNGVHGDPAAALLEVLDPEQNRNFTDTYIELPFDLSNAMFIATANSFEIPAPLLDRMEIIELSSYSEEEKMQIAKTHLLPKQIEANKVKANELTITDEAILTMIRNYTHEAGVRNLERCISQICRKVIKEVMMSDKKAENVGVVVDDKNIAYYLGPKVYDLNLSSKSDKVGIVNGLAYTQVGGEVLTIEAVAMPGTGRREFTGHLGDVMKESITAAMTVIRANAEALHIAPEFASFVDVHIHCPMGAVPKDGPSAGIAMCTALASVLTDNPVRCDVAMTGEISLRGDVLPIGGLREKLLAAVREGIKKVLIPKDNVKDLEELPQVAKDALTIVPVTHVLEVFSEALAKPYQDMPTKKLLKIHKDQE